MAEDEPGYFDLLQGMVTQDPDAQIKMRVKVKHDFRRRREELSRVRKQFDPKVDKIRRKALAQFSRLDVAFGKAIEANQTQKVWYTFSLMNVLGIGMAVAHAPHLTHIIYTVELLFLLPIRFWTYNRTNQQYYLADLCYYANVMLLAYLWIWPESPPLWISCFAFSYGSLAAAVIMWRNSLVLQSIDKTTSTFIHLMPPLTLYCIHFRIDKELKTTRFSGAYHTDTWNTATSVVITTVAYFVWQLSYHYFITVRRADNIRNGTVTSFEFMRRRYAKSRLGRFVNRLPRPLPVVAFTMIQFMFQIVTMLPCPLYYKYESLCTLALLFLFAAASFNGASYYIEVYGQRFHKQMKELELELKRLTEEAEEDVDEVEEDELEKQDEKEKAIEKKIVKQKEKEKEKEREKEEEKTHHLKH